MILTADNIVNATKFCDCFSNCFFQSCGLPYISWGSNTFLASCLRKLLCRLSQAFNPAILPLLAERFVKKARLYLRPTIAALAPWRIYPKKLTYKLRCWKRTTLRLTIASVIPRHIPDPPPVQKRTFPLKISGLNIAVESTIGTSCALEEGDMARGLEATKSHSQRKHRPKSDWSIYRCLLHSQTTSFLHLQRLEHWQMTISLKSVGSTRPLAGMLPKSRLLIHIVQVMMPY